MSAYISLHECIAKMDDATQNGAPKVIHGGEYRPNYIKFVLEAKEDQPSPDTFDVALTMMEVGSNNRLLRCVTLYTGNKVFEQMNHALRNDEEEGLKTYGRLIRETRDAFWGLLLDKPAYKLKPFLGTVFRKVTMSPEELETYKVGDELTWEGFSSSSTGRINWPGNVVFQINCCFAIGAGSLNLYLPADVSEISAYPGEQEVLFPPYVKFRILNVVKETPKPGLTTIVLETVEFPSVSNLIENEDWKLVLMYIEMQKQGKSKVGAVPKFGVKANWLQYQLNAAFDIMQPVAKKIAQQQTAGQTGLVGAGMKVFNGLWEQGVSPTIPEQGTGGSGKTALDVLKEARVPDSLLTVPPGNVVWLFHADAYGSGDEAPMHKVHEEGGKKWQLYESRQSAELEAKLQAHKDRGNDPAGLILETESIKNNIGVNAVYSVSLQPDGSMFQKANPGSGMLGRPRAVRRAVWGNASPKQWLDGWKEGAPSEASEESDKSSPAAKKRRTA